MILTIRTQSQNIHVQTFKHIFIFPFKKLYLRHNQNSTDKSEKTINLDNKSEMYNNFLAEKKKHLHDQKALIQKKMTVWAEKYHHKIQPQLLDRYNHRINTFITKIEQNPHQLQRFEPADIKKQKQEHLKQEISDMSRKGNKTFKYRDATDFSSFFGQAERIERKKNSILFEKKYGDSSMAYRSIASQSQYNPSLMNEFRRRNKDKEINPPMRYTNKIDYKILMPRKAKSVADNRKDIHLRTEGSRHEENDPNHLVRTSTSATNSVIGTEDLNKSGNSMRDESQSSQGSQKNLKKFAVTLQNPNKQRKKQSSKSYFVGLTDIKLNSKDPHLKKTLHSILVKIGKSHPNPRDKHLLSHVQVLSSDIN